MSGGSAHDGARLHAPAARRSMAAAVSLLIMAFPAAHLSAEEEVAPAADLSDLGLDDAGAFDFGDLDIEDEIALLHAEDVVVSATRHEQRISESPSTITVIGREELSAGWYRDVADVLRMVPGGDVYRINPMTVTVGIRAGTTATANRVLLLVDGRDVALLATGQPQWNALPVDLDSIERIEIIRGPGSSIYGANAFQGVVNIITRRPSEKPLEVEGGADFAGPNTHGADARAHGSWRGHGWWLNAGFEREGHFQAPDELGYQSHRARGRVFLDLSEDLEAVIDAGYGDARGRHSSPVGEGPSSWRTPYVRGMLRWPATEVHVCAEASEATMAPENEFMAPEGALGSEPLDLGTVDPVELSSRSIELMAFHSLWLFDEHRLMFGGAGRAIHHGRGAVLGCPELEPGETFRLDACDEDSLTELRAGAFVQAELKMTEGLGLTAGIRADANSIHPELGLSPRLAMVWAPREGQAIRTSAGRAYRKPSFFESHMNLSYRPTEDVPGEIASRLQEMFALGSPNPDLRNETVDAIEAGWLGRFLDGRLTASLDLYGMFFEGRITGRADNLEFVPGLGGTVSLHQDARITYENRHLPQWAVGGEATVSVRPARWLRVDTHYNHQGVFNVREEDGERVSTKDDWTPRHRVNLSAKLGAAGGPRLLLSGHWSSSYRRWLQHPDSPLYDRIYGETGNRILVLGAVSYPFQLPSGTIEVGLAGRNLLFSEYREFTGISREEGTWGGEIIRPQGRLFVRGRF